MTTAKYTAHIAAHPDLPDDDAALAVEAALAAEGLDPIWAGLIRVDGSGVLGFSPTTNADQCRALEHAVREATGWMVGIDTWTGKGDVMWFDADGSGIEPSQQTWTDDNDLPARARAALLAMRAWHKESGAESVAHEITSAHTRLGDVRDGLARRGFDMSENAVRRLLEAASWATHTGRGWWRNEDAPCPTWHKENA